MTLYDSSWAGLEGHGEPRQMKHQIMRLLLRFRVPGPKSLDYGVSFTESPVTDASWNIRL